MSRMAAPASEAPVTAVASVAELTGGIPGPSRPGRTARRHMSGIFRWQTRPERIRGMAAVAVIVAVFLGLITAAIFGSVAGGLRLIGQQSEPEVLATTDLYYRLNDMDAQVASEAQARREVRRRGAGAARSAGAARRASTRPLRRSVANLLLRGQPCSLDTASADTYGSDIQTILLLEPN